jgi:hypothetical protein
MNNSLTGSTLPKLAAAQWRRLPIWTRGRYIDYWLARLLPFQPPTVLVLSFPRSGSSWVGGTLGRAANAAYLREPINQVLKKAQPKRVTVFPVEAEAPDPAYPQPALGAFAGLPTFAPHVVRWPAQWRLLDRPRRRLVIKEVNPMAPASWSDAFGRASFRAAAGSGITLNIRIPDRTPSWTPSSCYY